MEKESILALLTGTQNPTPQTLNRYSNLTTPWGPGGHTVDEVEVAGFDATGRYTAHVDPAKGVGSDGTLTGILGFSPALGPGLITILRLPAGFYQPRSRSGVMAVEFVQRASSIGLETAEPSISPLC